MNPPKTGSGIIDVPKLLSKEDNQDFNSVFSKLVQQLTDLPDLRDMPETNRWLSRVLHYNVPHGKMNRGLSTVLAYRFMAPEFDLDEANIHLSYVLGWTVEMLQAYLLMSDDLMDNSETRRGQLCWYRVNGVGGNGAVNDAFLVEGAIYPVLKMYFLNKDYYSDLMEIMHDVCYKTVYGQSLDTRTGLDRKMETYTMERYSAIVKYKTSHYSFYLPVRLAMAMAGIKEEDLINQVKTVTLEIGHFFQVQDDFLDCYGDVTVTGKVGTDIQDCKCSWLFVTAMERATPEQKKILLENYGEEDEVKVSRVKALYLEMKIPELYVEYEKQTFKTISSHIQQMSPKLPKILFAGMLDKIYQRSS